MTLEEKYKGKTIEEKEAALKQLKEEMPFMVPGMTEEELKAAEEKMMQSAQKLFEKMYEQTQQNGGQAGPDMNMGGGAGTDSGAGSNDDVVDADYKEV